MKKMAMMKGYWKQTKEYALRYKHNKLKKSVKTGKSANSIKKGSGFLAK